ADDEVAPFRLELIGGDDADAPQPRQNDRQLERDAEGEDELHHQAEGILDLGQELDGCLAVAAGWLHGQGKAGQNGAEDAIDDESAEQEEDRRRHQVRQERLLFVAIEAGRDEHVDLRRDDRERYERRAEHRELELDDEIFEQAGIDELGILRARDPDERPRHHVLDRLGGEEAADKGDGEGDQRLDQPRTQLDQVLHQRRFGRLDLLLVVLAAHADLPSGLAASAAAVDGSGAADDGTATSVLGATTGSAPAGAALGSAGTGALGASAPALSTIALSICCCVLSSSRRTSLTGSQFA